MAIGQTWQILGSHCHPDYCCAQQRWSPPRHSSTAWVHTDEVQDAVYFSRTIVSSAIGTSQHIYGAVDLLKEGHRGRICLHESSKEQEWSANEVKRRWHMAVRDKLIRRQVTERKKENVDSF